MRGKEFLEKINDIDNRLIEEASKVTKKKNKSYIKWSAIAACFALLIIMPFINNVSQDFQKKYLVPIEVVIELNDKLYSVVNSDKSPAFENCDLEKNITPDLVGEYLGDYETSIDNDNKRDTFKIYRYQKCEVTEYNWVPRLIVEDSKGEFYHALIGSPIYTPQEVLTVYGIHSAKDIISVSNIKGFEISDSNFISEFYNGLFTKEPYGNDKMQEIVYQSTGLPEKKVNRLKVKLKNGLVIGVTYTSRNFVEVDRVLYFGVDDSWLELVSVFS